MTTLFPKIAGIDDDNALDLISVRAHITTLRNEIDVKNNTISDGKAANERQVEELNSLRQVNGVLATQLNDMADDKRDAVKRANEAESRALRAEDQANLAQRNADRLEGYVNRVRETDGIEIERRRRGIPGGRSSDLSNGAMTINAERRGR